MSLPAAAAGEAWSGGSEGGGGAGGLRPALDTGVVAAGGAAGAVGAVGAGGAGGEGCGLLAGGSGAGPFSFFGAWEYKTHLLIVQTDMVRKFRLRSSMIAQTYLSRSTHRMLMFGKRW